MTNSSVWTSSHTTRKTCCKNCWRSIQIFWLAIKWTARVLWLLSKREAELASEQDGASRWSVDHLFLDQDGIPTIVEVKRSRDTRIRREVVGQMLDYAANAVVYWHVKKTRDVRITLRSGRQELLKRVVTHSAKGSSTGCFSNANRTRAVEMARRLARLNFNCMWHAIRT